MITANPISDMSLMLVYMGAKLVLCKLGYDGLAIICQTVPVSDYLKV